MATNWIVSESDRIQFLFERLPDPFQFGDFRLYNDGPMRGSLAVENQAYRHNEPFECMFGGGVVVRGPGAVERQTIRLILDGTPVDHEIDHTIEFGFPVHGPRPLIEFEDCEGRTLHFAYRRMCFAERGIVPLGHDVWCRAIPIITESPMPCGILSRQCEQLWDLATLTVFMTGMAGFMAGAVAAALAAILESLTK